LPASSVTVVDLKTRKFADEVTAEASAPRRGWWQRTFGE
jgi:hypothetical protein